MGGAVTAYTPRLGDIGLTRVHGLARWPIRLGQFFNGTGFSDFEHAFSVAGFDPNDGTPIIVEAEPGGAVAVPLHYDPAQTVYLHCPDPYREAVAAAALRYAASPGHPGVGYSFLDYDALALHRMHIPAPGLQDYIADTGHMICSQLTDQAAADGGWHLFRDGRWPGYVTPGDEYLLYRIQEGAA
jgi:hypothetical protein